MLVERVIYADFCHQSARVLGAFVGAGVRYQCWSFNKPLFLGLLDSVVVLRTKGVQLGSS